MVAGLDANTTYQFSALARNGTGTPTELSGAATASTLPEHIAPAVVAQTAPYSAAGMLAVTFSEYVDVGIDQLSVVTGGGATVDVGGGSVVFDTTTNTAYFRLYGLLPDDDLTATLHAAGVQDTSGNAIGADVSFGFFNLKGDANRDRRVGFEDLVAVAQHYDAVGTGTWATGDFNGDGNVDFDDLVALAQNYDKSLAGAPAPAAALTFQAAMAAAFAPAVATAPAAKPPVPVKPPVPIQPPALAKTPTVKPFPVTAGKPTPVAAQKPKLTPVPKPKSVAAQKPNSTPAPKPKAAVVARAPAASAPPVFGSRPIRRSKIAADLLS